MRRLMSMVMIIHLAGCCSLPREAVMPVPVSCPAPPELPALDLPLAVLRTPADPAETVRALVVIIQRQATRIDEQAKILDGYRNKGGP